MKSLQLSTLFLLILLFSMPFSYALQLHNPLDIHLNFDLPSIHDRNNSYKYVDPSGENPVFVTVVRTLLASVASLISD